MATGITGITSEQQNLLSEIARRFTEKEHEPQVPNKMKPVNRNVLLTGRAKSGMTTLAHMWKDPTMVPEDPTLLHRYTTANIHTIVDQKSMLTITVLDTSSLSDGQDWNEQLIQLYDQCKKVEITDFHLICYCISMDEGIRQQDIACIYAMEKMFGVDIKLNLCLIVTRCESKRPQQIESRFTELKNDIEFKKVALWFERGFYASGSLKYDDWNQGNQSIITQFENIYRYREELFNLLKRNIEPVQLRLLREESTPTSPLLNQGKSLAGDRRAKNATNFGPK